MVLSWRNIWLALLHVHEKAQVVTMFASRNKCIATSNKCLTSSNKKLAAKWSKQQNGYSVFHFDDTDDTEAHHHHCCCETQGRGNMCHIVSLRSHQHAVPVILQGLQVPLDLKVAQRTALSIHRVTSCWFDLESQYIYIYIYCMNLLRPFQEEMVTTMFWGFISSLTKQSNGLSSFT